MNASGSEIDPAPNPSLQVVSTALSDSFETSSFPDLPVPGRETRSLATSWQSWQDGFLWPQREGPMVRI